MGTPFAPGFFAPGFLLPVPLPFFLALCLCEAGFLVLVGVVVVPGWLCVEVACFFPGWAGCGAVCVDVVEVEVEVVVELEVELEVEVEVELELELDVELEVELDVELDELDVALLVVEVVDGESVVVVVSVGHETPTRVPPAGSGTGLVAAGMATVASPVGRRTVARQSASATGIMAIAWMASTVITVASATVSFRLLNTLGLSPPAIGRAQHRRAATESRRETQATHWDTRLQRRTIRWWSRCGYTALRTPKGQGFRENTL